MSDTLNINLAGMLFRIDVKAYEVLRNYLQVISSHLGGENDGNETIEDIELRIAEIFNSQKDAKEVVTLENVETMISIIGAPADFAQYEENEPIGVKRKRLYRNPNDKMIAGVCGGLGAYLNIDPVLIRVLFAVITIFFGTGFFIYLILWIVVLPANSEERQRELHGEKYGRAMAQKRQSDKSRAYYNKTAVNEMFETTTNVLYAIIRVALIFVGILFVTIGFVFLLSFLFLFFFGIPEMLIPNTLGISLANMPDFLKFMITPQLYPCILILGAIVVLLPLMALIYWGVKMIFWFKAKDGILSLILLIIWFLSATALGLLMFAEGISFAEQSISTEQTQIQTSSDTLYIKAKNRISDIETNDMLSFRAGDYYMLIDNEKRELHIRPELSIRKSKDDSESITIRKSANGINGAAAFDKAQMIDYNCQIAGDTIYIDDYFSIASNYKWSAENVNVLITLAEGKVIKVDESIDKLISNHRWIPRKKIGDYSYWIITNDKGLVPY
jgi:phage shock protein PspC (stress-responsive transcriptional regulator)